MNQQSYWTVERQRSVTEYLINLREAGVELRRAINSLHEGIPDWALQIQADPEVWEWLIADHWITFVVERSRQWIYVVDVKALENN